MAEIDNVIVNFHHENPKDNNQDIAEYSIIFTEKPEVEEPTFEISYYVDGYKNGTSSNVSFEQEKASDTNYKLKTIKTGYIGDIAIVVKWKDSFINTSGNKENVTRIRDCILPAGSEVNKSIIDQSDHPPQLFAAIKKGDEKKSPSIPATLTGADIEKVIIDIYDKLSTGIGPAWENGGYSNELTPGTSSAQLEECWAQYIATMLSGCPYYGSGWAYGQGSKSWKVFSLYLDKDPAYPIALACEHLSNMALLSRVEYTEGEWIGASGAPGSFDKMAKKFASKGCKYIKDSKYGNINNAVRGDGSTWTLRPASMYAYENPKFAHVAFIERVFINTLNAQFLDTGAMGSYNGDDADPKVANSGRLVGGNRPGNMEYSFIRHPQKMNSNDAIGGHSSYKGLLISPTLTITELQTACNKMKIARPLGIARLVLLERKTADESIQTVEKGHVLWASPLLPMWYVNGTDIKPFPISLLLWSLRNHLYHEKIEARWQIDLPRDALFEEIKTSKKDFLWQNYNSNTTLPDKERLIFLEIGSKNDGHAQFVSYAYSSYDPDTGKTTDKTTGPARADFLKSLKIGGRGVDLIEISEFPNKKPVDNSKIPEYFRGAKIVAAPPTPGTLIVKSSSFKDGTLMNVKYGKNGSNRSPHLQWSGAPAGTVTFVILCEDLDNGNSTHWICYDISSSITSLPEKLTPKPAGLMQGQGDYGPGWVGPFPPAGTEHQYLFTIYALNKSLGFPDGKNKVEITQSMQNAVLAKGTITGKFKG
jgi:Raf kinase inhibitor-like YbhB/YbcL family protein